MFNIENLIEDALREDLGHGDITSLSIVSRGTKAEACIVTHENIILAGNFIPELLYRKLDPEIKITCYYDDGDHINSGSEIIRISGDAASILMGERVCLNFLQRLSGIATYTAKFAEKIKGFPVKILDTRKTTPLLRKLEKYAVRMGGGYNHRMGLFDGILIKDNHIKIAGGVKEAIRRVRKKDINPLLKIEVEVRNLDELKDAIDGGADIVMLDNMGIDEIKKAVSIAKGRVMIEVSGRITLENIRDIASLGVDFISVGAITHSAPSADLSMEIL